MWELINNLIKSGFPLLGLIFFVMILVVIWRNPGDLKPKKWYWTAVLLVPPLLSTGLYLLVQSYPPSSPMGSMVATLLMIGLFVVGIPVWLIGSR